MNFEERKRLHEMLARFQKLIFKLVEDESLPLDIAARMLERAVESLPRRIN